MIIIKVMLRACLNIKGQLIVGKLFSHHVEIVEQRENESKNHCFRVAFLVGF